MASNVNAVTQINETHINEKIYVSTWIVKNFNFNLSLKEGQFITSPAFQIESKLYKLKLYPYGKSSNYKNYVSLDISNELHLESYRSDVYLVNKTGNEELVSTICSTSSTSYFTVERSRIISDFLVNGHLTIKWHLRYLLDEDLIQMSSIQSINNVAEKRRPVELDDFEKLLEDNRFSDFKVIVDSQTFYAHKCILAARSRYFAAMFESNMKEEKEGEIQITDISENIMREILRFIYTGKIDVEMTMITDFLIVANMYGLDGLTAICEEAIISNISLENIGSILTDIDRLKHAENFKDSAIEFLRKNAKVLSGNESFRKVLDSLSPSFVVEIMNTMMSKM